MNDEIPIFQAIKANLPNFPDDVIQEWLLPFAITLGWPPEKSSDPLRWVNILDGTVSEWKKRMWQLEEIDLSTILLSRSAFISAEEMHQAYCFNAQNSYSNLRDDGGSSRHFSALLYILEHGKFPKPIILLSISSEYEIVDGNHRFLAWRTAKEMLSALHTLPKNQVGDHRKMISTKWGINTIVIPSDTQLVWIAR